jgi:hypothetical protein
MKVLVRFRAIPFHICTLLTAMLMCSMPTQAGTVFYDFAAPANQDDGFSATGFIEIDDDDAVGFIQTEFLNKKLFSWSFMWSNGEDDFSVTSHETGLTSDKTGGLMFNESSDLVNWYFGTPGFCPEGCGSGLSSDSPHVFFAQSAPGGDSPANWFATTDISGFGNLLVIVGVGGTGGLWTRRAAVAAPEPAVSGLLALGLLAVGATKRRKC